MDALLAASCPFWPCGLIVTVVVGVVSSVVAYAAGKKAGRGTSH